MLHHGDVVADSKGEQTGGEKAVPAELIVMLHQGRSRGSEGEPPISSGVMRSGQTRSKYCGTMALFWSHFS